MEDAQNGSLMRFANRSDKIGSVERQGNAALDIDRPVLPILTFSELKEHLLYPNQSLPKPDIKFLDVQKEEA